MWVQLLCYPSYFMLFSKWNEALFLSFLQGETSENKQSKQRQIFDKLDEHQKVVIHERNRVLHVPIC
jgi:hypothetical protein